MSVTLSERVRGLTSLIAIVLSDAALLEGGRKSRSPTIRKNLSILQKECSALRKACLETQKAIPTKARIAKVAPVGCNPTPQVAEVVAEAAPVASSVAEAPPTPLKLLPLNAAVAQQPKRSRTTALKKNEVTIQA